MANMSWGASCTLACGVFLRCQIVQMSSSRAAQHRALSRRARPMSAPARPRPREGRPLFFSEPGMNANLAIVEEGSSHPRARWAG